MSIADRLAEIEARFEAATEGPWKTKRYPALGWYEDDVTLYSKRGYLVRPDTHGGMFNHPADAEFARAARTDLPATTAALRAVLALHVPASASAESYCLGCGFDAPCDTVRAITTALDGAS